MARENRKFWDLGPDETPASIWDAVNRVGLRNHYICSVLAARLMLTSRNELNEGSEDGASGVKPSKHARPGLIFNISSIGGLRHFFAVVYGVGAFLLPCLFLACAGVTHETLSSLLIIRQICS